ncbi:MAG: FHA domain-containing protein [Armatimonadota bacterium]|nr:FHA domain-containing protein [Armatimonadota bacterium]
MYDEGSTNGTYVNNARVTRHELANGDLVQIGSTKFRFEL